MPKICSILAVSEHELITASVDNEARQEKAQAKKWRSLTIAWDMFFSIAYIVALIPCFICNLAINKKLSWFWIVLSALILAFTFTHLPKLIKKQKLILLPSCMSLALCLLLGVCAVYTRGEWFFIAAFSILFVLLIIFIPIYIEKYEMFKNIKKYNDFISIGLDFIMLNILLIIINLFSVDTGWWYFKIGLPITLVVYFVLNILLCVKFIPINRFIKTGIILFLINLFMYVPSMFLKVENQDVQREIDQANILKANLSIWELNVTIENNIHLIIALTLMFLSVIFVVIGFRKKD